MRTIAALTLLAALAMPSGEVRGGDGEAAFAPFERSYAPEVRPLLARHCVECHGAARSEADIDLSAFATLADLRADPTTWQKVAEMLDSGQMPPRKAKSQPTPAERERLLAWVRGYLAAEARAHSGDPGRVVLRRLDNAEYTYTIRDLTGVAALDPAREFPADGAAGEGFTNTGNALVMSPALVTKYLDAAKEIADHAVLLPDGLRFSPKTTRRDWTEEILAEIRAFYARFTESGGGEKVNLQGLVFNTNEGGGLPLEKYLAATLAGRDAIRRGNLRLDDLARDRGLNPRYLATLWKALEGGSPSLLLGRVRESWRAATPEQAAALTAEVAAWQQALWRLRPVGQIGRVGGPTARQEPVNPLASSQEIRQAIAATADGPASHEARLVLAATDAGDDRDHDLVVWKAPRLVAPGRPDLRLKDVRALTRGLAARRKRIFGDAAKFLDAAAEAESDPKADPAELARRHGVDPDALRAWLDYLGLGPEATPAPIERFATTIRGGGGHDFIRGWGSNETPQLLANSSDEPARVPGNVAPHGVVLHPSPTRRAAAGWRSPIAGRVRVEARVVHAHPECGNGVAWALELRRGATRQQLASGVVLGAGARAGGAVGPFENLGVQAGDLVSLVVGAIKGNHACDLTEVNLTIRSRDGGDAWDLAADVSGDVLAGNPHADRLGREGIWHFYSEPDEPATLLPAGSLLARWQTAGTAEERHALALALQTLLATTPRAAAEENPDAVLCRQLASLGGPLYRGPLARGDVAKDEGPGWGLDPQLFDAEGNLRVAAPSVVEVRLPAELAAEATFVTTAALDPRGGGEGSVQVFFGVGEGSAGFLQDLAAARGPRPDRPILVDDRGPARRRIEAALDEFRALFPIVLCYPKIVPVDEVITLMQFYREDGHLARLMLDEAQRARLDRLWDELHFVSQDALTEVDALEQLIQYATQDGNPKALEPLRKPFNARAEAFRKRALDAQPKQLEAVLALAARAFRRPLSDGETRELRGLYDKLRREEIPHDEAIRLAIARVLVAPAFLYRVETPVPGTDQGPVSDWELASRLSYFLWSSMPDEELSKVAASGRLHDPEVLVAQMKRMLGDAKTRRLAVEFACHWLQIADFDRLDEKSERHFPEFARLRGAMYEESIRFLTDLFQNDRPVLSILDADHTFLSPALARHYGIPIGAPEASSEWFLVRGVKAFGRGGMLAQATTLSKQSGASRTSPTLRGHWIGEVLLGERLPRPPKGVPQLPDDESATEGLTVRQLVEKHASDAKCSVCHERIDPLGFALEGFDAIGRARKADLGDRPIDAKATTRDGATFEGLDGLRNYLIKQRADAFRRQFCRKLLGYALGRAVMLSDEPLLDAMQADLKANGDRATRAIAAVVLSRQFREIRGLERSTEE